MVDHSAAAPYLLLDIKEVEADVLALNVPAWVARRSARWCSVTRR